MCIRPWAIPTIPPVFGSQVSGIPDSVFMFWLPDNEVFGAMRSGRGKTREAPTFGVGIPGRTLKAMATKPWVLAWGKGAAVPQPTKSGA